MKKELGKLLLALAFLFVVSHTLFARGLLEDVDAVLHPLGLVGKSVPQNGVGSPGYTSCSVARDAVLRILYFYRRFISSQDLPVCNFVPSCSEFAVQAIDRLGVLKGGLLAVDRLERDHGLPGMAGYYSLARHGSGKYSDPIGLYLRACANHGKVYQTKDRGHPARYQPFARHYMLRQFENKPDASISDSRASSLFGSDKQLGFADYLFGLHDYNNAIREYQRYLYFETDTEKRAYAQLKTAACFEKLGDVDVAWTYAKTSLGNAKSDTMKVLAIRQLMALSFRSTDCFHRLSLVAGIINANANGNVWIAKLEGVKFLCYLKQRGDREIPNVGPALPVDEKSSKIDSVRTHWLALRSLYHRKSPLLAGLLSTFVPGLGKVYTRRSWDGAFAATVTAGTAWLAYSGFRAGGHNLKAWTFASLSVGFYIGNIYGSFCSAKIYNLKQEKAFNDRLEKELENWLH